MVAFKDLPVYQHRQEILSALENSRVVVVESPTGSGKTTQIPLILHEAGYSKSGVIGITQPRRIATLSVCEFIQKQLEGSGLPSSFCGYKMRFYDTTDERTGIKILTDGMLLQEMKLDPLVSRYSVIMVDEAHERSLNIDFILGMLKQILSVRNDLRVIISSATINTSKFANFFASEDGKPAPVISIDAKKYDVGLTYYPLKAPGNPDETAKSICQIIGKLLKDFRSRGWKDPQDTLVFLPGEADIKFCLGEIYRWCDFDHLQLYTLYGRMNKEDQERVFELTQSGRMKVVLATNIAETSLTIDGIKAVIDSGYAKMNFYNQRTFTSSLVQRPVSKASALQRTGRAGRTAPGVCYRLYSKDDFASRERYTREEIRRTDLSEVVMRMSDLGIYDFENFPFITSPDREALSSGEQTLRMIGAIGEDRRLTATGRIMALYPLLPRHSRCMAEAVMKYPEMVFPLAVCISFLSCRTPFVLPQGEEEAARSAHRSLSGRNGDFASYLTLYSKYTCIKTEEKRKDFCSSMYLDVDAMDEIVHVTRQLCTITREMGFAVSEEEKPVTSTFFRDLMLCLMSGLLQYICVRKKGMTYRTLTTDEIYIHPGSSWFRNPPQYLLAGEIVETSRMYARTVSPIDEMWLNQLDMSLAKRLSKLATSPSQSSGSRESAKPSSKEGIKEGSVSKTVQVFGFTLPAMSSGGKHPRPVVIIDCAILRKFCKAWKNASRRPKDMLGAISFNGSLVLYGEKLENVVRTGSRIDFCADKLENDIMHGVFSVGSAGDLEKAVPMMDKLLHLCPLARERNKLGFIEMIRTGDSFMFHVNRSYTEAVNNTAYSLLSIIDETDAPKKFSDTYYRILRLFD